MAQEQNSPRPTSENLSNFSGWRDLGRAEGDPVKLRQVIGQEVLRFIRLNRPRDEFFPSDELFAIGAYNRQANRFFHQLYEDDLLNEDQRRMLNRFGVPPDLVPPPAPRPPERLNDARTQVQQILSQEDRAIESLISGENGERTATRSRAGRTFTKISHLVRDLTVIPKGARVTEPKGRWRPKSRRGRLANAPPEPVELFTRSPGRTTCC